VGFRNQRFLPADGRPAKNGRPRRGGKIGTDPDKGGSAITVGKKKKERTGKAGPTPKKGKGRGGTKRLPGRYG